MDVTTISGARPQGRAEGAGRPDAPGRSNDAVGQRAKALVAARPEAALLPARAQGQAASALARGMSPDAVFQTTGGETPVSPDAAAEAYIAALAIDAQQDADRAAVDLTG